MKYEMLIIFILSTGIQKCLSAIACHKCEPPNDCRNPDINPPPPDDREAICFEPEAVCTTTQRTQDVGGISNTIIERGCSDSTMFCEDFRALYEPSLTNVQCEVCKNDSFCNNKIFALPETTPTVSSTTITTTPSTTTTIRSSPSTTTSRPMKTTWKYDRSSTISRWSIRTTTRTTRKYYSRTSPTPITTTIAPPSNKVDKPINIINILYGTFNFQNLNIMQRNVDN